MRIRTMEQSTGQHIPVIAMTAHAMQSDRDRCIAAGMDAYLSKPIEAVKLLETIQNCRRKQVVDEAVHNAPND
jgi:CheY-like chemotaxis protein